MSYLETLSRVVGVNLKESAQRCLPKVIKPHRIIAGPLKGSWIVTSWRDYPSAILGFTEIPLLGWFTANVKAGETWLDVGAHYGYTTISLCNLVGDAGCVYAFEPLVASAGSIYHTRRLNRFSQLTVLPLALNNEADVMLSALPESRGMVDSTLTESASKEPFLVSKLDWLWPKICGLKDRIDGVKIDVQGMELEVLRGMACILKRNRPKLVIELHKGVHREELFTILSSVNYGLPGVTIEPTSLESTPLYLDDRSYAFFPQAS